MAEPSSPLGLLPLVVFGLSMAVVPLSDWRILAFDFLGPRSVSVFHVSFALYTALFLLDWRASVGVLKTHWKPLAALCAPLMLMLLSFAVHQPEGKAIVGHSFLVSMVIAGVVLVTLARMEWNALSRRLSAYVGGMLAVLMVPIVALTTGWFPWWREHVDLSFYVEEFTFPFVNPNRASFFVQTCLFLGLGVLLSDAMVIPRSRKVAAVIAMVATVVLAVALSGSRTGVISFVGLLGLFAAGYGTWRAVRHRSPVPSRWLVSPTILLLGVLLGAAAVVSNGDKPGVQRAAGVVSSGPIEYLTGRADPFRHAMWAKVLPSLQDHPNAPALPSGFDPAKVVAEGGSLHNVFLDLYVWAGPVPAACFLAFFTVAVGLAAGRCIETWKGPSFPVAWACLMLILQIIAFMYTQPLAYFVPIWVAVGVIGALLFRVPVAPRAGQVAGEA